MLVTRQLEQLEGVMGMGKVDRMFHKKERGMTITRLMARDGGECRLCGEQLDRHIKDPNDPLFVTIDHILSPGDGGTEELANKQLAHRKCNITRGREPLMPTEEFRLLFLGKETPPQLEASN